MLKAALVALIALVGCSLPAPVAPATPEVPPRSAAELAYEQAEVIDYMLTGTPAEDTVVIWGPCWESNAFFWPPHGPVVLCLELSTDGVFAAAHEAAHALVIRMHMDPAGPDPIERRLAHERAADDLATLFLIEMGKEDEALEGVRWFVLNWEAPREWGTHPLSQDRARRMLCLLDGAAEPPATWTNCSAMYRDVWYYWAEQLTLAMDPSTAK